MGRIRIGCAALGGFLLACAAVAQEPCACPRRSVLLQPFLERLEQLPDGSVRPAPAGRMPERFSPWWEVPATKPLLPPSQALPVDLEGLMLSSLEHSARIHFLTEARLVAGCQLAEAQAAFDWRGFMETNFLGLSEPVGNLLTTGGADRFRDRNWNYTAGLRRHTPGGGQLEISQRIGYEDQNSIYFYPTDQGSSLMTVQFARPLLRGAGADYNARLILLAEIEAASSDREFLRQAQAHLIELDRAYWQLYLARAMLLQKRQVWQQAERIHKELVGRQRVDAVSSQVLQAQAAVARRRAEIIRAEMTVRNMESRIRALVNDPRLGPGPAVEFVPADGPEFFPVAVGLKPTLYTALLSRPEIEQALCDVSAARVKLNVAENELLPALDVILETYASGLRGNSNIGSSLGDQFTEGEPSYTIGLALDVPLQNRAAKARNCRQQIELRKTMFQLANVAETVWAEVEIAVREVHTAWEETAAQYHAMVAKDAEVRSLEARWRLLSGDGNVGSVLLEQLLQSQEGLAATEFAFAGAVAGYHQALARLKQADGTLLVIQRVPGSPAGPDRKPPLLLQDRPDRPPIPATPRTAARVTRLPPVR